jgi:DNA invertase Pin-like site-specific DNA recombinase
VSATLVAQARLLAGELERARSLVGELSQQRADMIRQAIDGGMSQSEVAKALGISRQAVNLALLPPERRKQIRRARREDG